MHKLNNIYTVYVSIIMYKATGECNLKFVAYV